MREVRVDLVSGELDVISEDGLDDVAVLAAVEFAGYSVDRA